MHNRDRRRHSARVERAAPAEPRRARAARLHAARTARSTSSRTSRGCTFDCSFCSIIEMRGRNFHPYPIDRVLADIADARAHGAEAIFLVDDNITLDVERFEALCQAIVDAGFDDADYIVQAMTAPLAQHGARLAPLMRRAGFRYVFLGIENILDEDLEFLRARAKNARREHGRTIGNASIEAIAPPARARHVRRRRPDRRQPGRHASVDRSQPRVRQALRRLAAHPAPDAVLRARR